MKTNIKEEVQKIVWDCKCQKEWSDTATKKILNLIQKRLLKAVKSYESNIMDGRSYQEVIKEELSTKEK